MDIGIQGPTDGLGAAREIIGSLGIPVVFMTGFDDEEIIQAAALKPLAVLVKPLDVNPPQRAARAPLNRFPAGAPPVAEGDPSGSS